MGEERENAKECDMKRMLIVLWLVVFIVFSLGCFLVKAEERTNDVSQQIQFERKTKLDLVKQEIWRDNLAERSDKAEKIFAWIFTGAGVVLFSGVSICLLMLALFLKLRQRKNHQHEVGVIVTVKGRKYKVFCRCVCNIDGGELWFSPFVSPKTGAGICAPSKDELIKRSLKGSLRQDIFAEQKKKLIEEGKILKIS